MSDESVTGTKRRKFVDALQNGPGTVISRLIIMAMPFMAAGSIWLGEKAMDLLADRVERHFENIDKHLDKIDAAMETSEQFGRRLELQVQRNSDSIDYLKDGAPPRRDRERDR